MFKWLEPNTFSISGNFSVSPYARKLPCPPNTCWIDLHPCAMLMFQACPRPHWVLHIKNAHSERSQRIPWQICQLQLKWKLNNTSSMKGASNHEEPQMALQLLWETWSTPSIIQLWSAFLNVSDIYSFNNSGGWYMLAAFVYCWHRSTKLVNQFSLVDISDVVLVGGCDRSVEVFDLNIGRPSARIPGPHTRAVHHIAQNKVRPHWTHSGLLLSCQTFQDKGM